MARKPRIEYPGAFYHVMTRGNRRGAIFKDDKDRLRFLRKLLEYKKRYGFILYAYILMKNHIHLLIETRDAALSKIMQGLLQSYTQWYNGKYRTVGHLFQGRYKSILCDKKVYLLNLIRYIHLNCVRAGIVKDPGEYKWSSHRIYLGYEERKLIDTDFVLSQFSRNKREAVKMYKAFVLEWLGDSSRDEFYSVIDQRFLGEGDFVVEVKSRVGEELLVQDTIKDKILDEIALGVEQVTGVGLDDLRGRSRGKEKVEARGLFVRLALLYSKSKRGEIASYLGRTSKMVCYLEKKIDDKKLRVMERILEW